MIDNAFCKFTAAMRATKESMRSFGGLKSSSLLRMRFSQMSLRLSRNIAGSSPLSLSRSSLHETKILCLEESMDSLPMCPVGMIVRVICPS